MDLQSKDIQDLIDKTFCGENLQVVITGDVKNDLVFH